MKKNKDKVNKFKDIDEKETKKEKKQEVKKDTLEVFSIRYYDKEIGAYVCKDKSLIGIVEVATKDIPNLLDDEVQRDELLMAKFYKLFDEVKIVSLNFPTNTLNQRIFLQKCCDKTNSPARKKWLRKSIDELERIDKNTTKREYYLFFFAKDENEYNDKLNLIGSVLGFGLMGNCNLLSDAKKHQIIFKLNNMCANVIAEE